MSAGGAKFLELLLVLALVLGWGGYELWSLRRDRGRDAGPGAEADRERGAGANEGAETDDSTGHAGGRESPSDR